MLGLPNLLHSVFHHLLGSVAVERKEQSPLFPYRPPDSLLPRNITDSDK